jgi:hypothetical protein
MRFASAHRSRLRASARRWPAGYIWGLRDPQGLKALISPWCPLTSRWPRQLGGIGHGLDEQFRREIYPSVAAGDSNGCRQIAAGTVPSHTYAHAVITELGDACENVAHGGHTILEPAGKPP